MSDKYILDGTTPVVEPNVMKWAKWMQETSRKVLCDELDGVKISTVFLGLDHAFNGPPMLFETMIFGGELDGEQERCSTWSEAEAQHRVMCDRVRKAERAGEDNA